MRILLINWARIYNGTDEGGGVNGYVQSLALELKKLNHQVISLTAGRDYAPTSHPSSAKSNPDHQQTKPNHTVGSIQLRREPDWLGLNIFTIVNSPVVAPSLAQFNDPLAEITSQDLERLLTDFIRTQHIDIAHFHNLEGLTAGCIRAARNAGAAVLASLHNYHTICPQVYLMQKHMHPCRDFDMGKACETCIDVPDPDVEKQRLIQVTIDRAIQRNKQQNELQADARNAYIQARRNLRHELNWPLRLARSAAAYRAAKKQLTNITGALPHNITTDHPPTPPPELGLPGVPADPSSNNTTTTTTQQEPTPDTRGQTAALRAEADAKPFVVDLAATHRLPLLNTVLPEPQPTDHNNPSLPRYARRRAAMIDALNTCDRVLAVSSTVRDIFVSKGVNADRIDVLHIGTKAARLAELNAELLAPPPPPLSPPTFRPIRLLFIGMNNYYKGLGMLAESLMLLAPAELAKFHLTIAARDVNTIEHVFRRIEPRLAGLAIHGSYTPHDIPWLCSQKDIGIVSSVWWDNAPQTVFEYLSCGLPVLGAALGGIPDFVIDQHNGLLFRGNDRQDLARQLRTIADEPEILATLRANVSPPKRIEHHAQELETLYTQLRAQTPPTQPQPKPTTQTRSHHAERP